jgi:hypothetical protein
MTAVAVVARHDRNESARRVARSARLFDERRYRPRDLAFAVDQAGAREAAHPERASEAADPRH